MINYLDRFTIMLSEQQIKNLANAKIIVFGVGGVGSALSNFLVRCGISNFDVVDFDIIDVTNINRQLVAFQNNIGKLKVEELKKQLLLINPNLNINIFPLKYGEETKNKFDFTKYSYVCDCIDDLPAKKLLIKQVKQAKTPLLCAMGAGNRYLEVPKFEIADISKTSYDPLAKIIRGFCAKEGIKKVNVCYTKQKAQKNDCNIIGSVVYYPVEMACVMCAKIINDVLEEV